MNEDKLKSLIDSFLNFSSETEWLEFKEAKNDYTFDKLGRYFSALSNEANLKRQDNGWLIFGVDDNRQIVGTKYRQHRTELDDLKLEIANHTNNNITFNEIHELNLPEGRVIMFQIPPAPNGLPVSWKGHYFGRNSESLSALNIQELEEIRRQKNSDDWSAEICEGATIDDLDEHALEVAREQYIHKHVDKEEEIRGWDDTTFLNKAKLTIQNNITRTAIILLGKPESEHFLSPSVAKMTWLLKDEFNLEKDYEHFGPPFLLNSEKVFEKVRNLKYRYMPDQSLFPVEINKYDPYVIREALHNCIAHQDYELHGRINIVEKSDELIFTNPGDFIPQSVERVITQDAPQEYYRNRFLTEAMVNLNMIDTIGSGIKRMFVVQRRRFFPLPDYNLQDEKRVEVRIIGKVLDENYTKALINWTDLDLDSVILLDKIQKGQRIAREDANKLKKQKLIEGRYPNLYVSSGVASVTDEKTNYIKNRAFDKGYYKDLIIDFLKVYGSASRQDIDNLLFEKLSNTLDNKQKKGKIQNLLYEMHKKDQSIVNEGSKKNSKWVLKDQ